MALARWQATIVDSSGNILPGTTITVLREVIGQPPAVLFSDRDGLSGISNPFVADASGFAAFHVTDGVYQITATNGTFSRTWRYVAVSLTSETPINQLVFLSQVRERLISDRTYYVSTTGNDGNNGLTPGTPFLTVAHALRTIRDMIDLAGCQAVVQVADGTYGESVEFVGGFVGMADLAPVIVRGNVATPANVARTVTGGPCFHAYGPCRIQLEGMTLSTLTASVGQCIDAEHGAVIYVGAGIVFGACADVHMRAHNRGLIASPGPGHFDGLPYTITGGATVHWQASSNSGIRFINITITLTGTPAFSTAFAFASQLSIIDCFGNTYVGAATGKRFASDYGSIIAPLTSNPNTLPGSIDGTTDHGATYDGAEQTGTFTPGIAFGGASVGVTYSAQVGRFIRVGNLVHVDITVTLTNKGTSVGNLTITGLPFTVSSIGNDKPASFFGVNLTAGSQASHTVASFVSNTQTMSVLGGDTVFLNNANVNNNTTFLVSGVYRI